MGIGASSQLANNPDMAVLTPATTGSDANPEIRKAQKRSDNVVLNPTLDDLTSAESFIDQPTQFLSKSLIQVQQMEAAHRLILPPDSNLGGSPSEIPTDCSLEIHARSIKGLSNDTFQKIAKMSLGRPPKDIDEARTAVLEFLELSMSQIEQDELLRVEIQELQDLSIIGSFTLDVSKCVGDSVNAVIDTTKKKYLAQNDAEIKTFETVLSRAFSTERIRKISAILRTGGGGGIAEMVLIQNAHKAAQQAIYDLKRNIDRLIEAKRHTATVMN
jgi:hypothetical protein